MLLGVVFALLALGVGALACRVLRVESDLAPLLGLASLAVTATWGIIAFGFPAAMVGISLLMTAAVGLRAWRPSPLVVVVAAAPVVVLGVAFAGLEVPVSNHDGAFHVETIDALRTGSTGAFWYPRGYHASVAAFLALMPWLDTAGGTLDLSQGLSVLAPLAVFGLGRAAGLSARAAAIGGVLT